MKITNKLAVSFLAFTIAALTGCGLGSLLSPNGSGTVVAHQSLTNLAYASVSSTQTLDLFVPSGGGPYPLVVYIHGGSFVSGSKADLDSTLQDAFLNGGMAIASINYRLVTEALFPAATQDAKAAIRFLRANASAYNLNPNKILIFGSSAGANLGDLVGTTSDVSIFDNPSLGNPGVSSRVQGVIDWAGPTDFSKMDAEAAAQGCGSGIVSSWLSTYLGVSLALNPQLVSETNPTTYVRSNAPPFLIQHGDQDCVVPLAQSQLLRDALANAGVQVTLETLAGAGHVTPSYFESSSNVTRIVNFAKSVLF